MEDKVKQHREAIDNWWLDNVYNPTGQYINVWLIEDIASVVIEYIQFTVFSYHSYYGYIDALSRRQGPWIGRYNWRDSGKAAGNKRWCYTYLDGSLHGPAQSWLSSGSYVDSRQDGLWTYHELDLDSNHYQQKTILCDNGRQVDKVHRSLDDKK
jgi:hypothetical protein